MLKTVCDCQVRDELGWIMKEEEEEEEAISVVNLKILTGGNKDDLEESTEAMVWVKTCTHPNALPPGDLVWFHLMVET
ncbi:hypothetical protein NPIL_133481 [Nephila pilipes]|uniref:Uncharacterized protein n=1 Tax=Nephila pilipes TaxID=299642 RepID=A0A8X6MX24_NEPPI|nr:hypothetical protein NPIL_133481 [Nephila pilipes]